MTFILGQDHAPWNNFLCRIALCVAENLELLGRAEQDVDVSTILVRHVVTESKK